MAILNVSSYITSAGLQSVTSAGAIGPYFAVKYFIPFYDPRIDSSISLGHSAFTSAINISALNLTSATANTLVGEKIYASNVANYNLSNADYFYQQTGMSNILDGATGTFNTKQESQARINLLSGKPLSQVVSAASVAPTSTIGSYTLTNAYNVSGTRLASYNPISASPYPTSAFFRVQSYSPKAVGSTSAVGTYKCRIPSGSGSFKFNGMALFVNKVDHYGFDAVGSSPVLFAVVLFDKPQIKSSVVGGVNSFEVDVDLGFDWNALSSGTSNTPIYVETNYWTKVPTTSNTSAYALNYDGDVVISSSAAPGSWVPKSKLTIVDPEKSQIRLSFDGGTFDRYTDIRQKRRKFSTIGEIGIYNNTTDIGVLSLDTACSSDSLLEIGTNVKSMTIKSITMGVNVSAFNRINTHQAGISTAYNFTFASNTIVGGHQNTTFGNAVSAYGRYNFTFGNNAFTGSKVGEPIFLDDDTRGYNFVFGKNVSAYSMPSETTTPSSMYFSDGLSNSVVMRGANVIFGSDIYAEGGNTLSIGKSLNTTGAGAVNLGSNNTNGGIFSLIQGYFNISHSHGATIFGYSNVIVKQNPFSFIHGTRNVISQIQDYMRDDYIGQVSVFGSENISLEGLHNFVVGNKNNIKYVRHAFVFGYSNILTNEHQPSSIPTTNGSGYNIVLGYSNTSTTIGSSIIGNTNKNNGVWTFVVGSNNWAKDTADESIIFGTKNISSAYQTAILGFENELIGTRSIAIGTTNISYGGTYSTLIGNRNISRKSLAFSIGNDNINNGDNSFTLGNDNTADHDNAIVIGDKALSTQSNQVYIGGDNIKNITLKADEIRFIGDMAEDPYYTYNITQKQTCQVNNDHTTTENIPFSITIGVVRVYGSSSISKNITLTTTNNNTINATNSGDSNTYYIYNPSNYSNHSFNVYINRTNLNMVICKEGELEIALTQSSLSNIDSSNYHKLIVANLIGFEGQLSGGDDIKIYEINNKTIGVNIFSQNLNAGYGVSLSRFVKFHTNTAMTFPIHANVFGVYSNRANNSSSTIRLVQGSVENGLGDVELASIIGIQSDSGQKTIFHRYLASKYFVSFIN